LTSGDASSSRCSAVLQRHGRSRRVRSSWAMPVVGFLSIRSSDTDAQFLVSFRQGLSERGFVEGRNVGIEHRYAQGQPDRLPSLAADLVRRQVAIIVTTGGAQAALAAKAATTAIPIVFSIGSDPVKDGLVQSLNRPGGNLTGVTTSYDEAAPKRLGLLREILPNSTVIAVLVDPNNPITASSETDLMRAAARSVGNGSRSCKPVLRTTLTRPSQSWPICGLVHLWSHPRHYSRPKPIN
jgi:ABC-type uncharacterized transport system substrate-binding protein